MGTSVSIDPNVIQNSPLTWVIICFLNDLLFVEGKDENNFHLAALQGEFESQPFPSPPFAGLVSELQSFLDGSDHLPEPKTIMLRY